MKDTGKDDISFADMNAAADRLFYAMRRARSVSTAASGLTLPQFALLDPLTGATELSVGGLAANADVSVPAATRMLQQLETKGIVIRRRSPADERQVLVRLTAEGSERIGAVRAWTRERQARTYVRFTPTERAQLHTLFHRVADSIIEASAG